MMSPLFADGTFRSFRVVLFLALGGILFLLAVGEVAIAKPAAVSGRLPQIGTVTMASGGYLSAGVYDSKGGLVRTLLARSPQEAGSVPLFWDGRDNLGRVVTAAGTYSWRALTSQVEAVDQGGVGDSFFTPNKLSPAGDSFIEMSEKLRSVAVGPDNSVYLLSRVEEGPTLVKFSQDGTVQWTGGSFLSYGAGITVDAKYVYVAGNDGNGGNKIHLINPSTGALSNLTNPIVVNWAAVEDFESGTGGSGGQNWTGNWSFTGPASITKSDSPRGVYHLRLAGNDGVASRQVDVRSGANMHLAFEWKRHNFAAGDSAIVEAYDGSTWQTVFKLTNAIGDGDNYTDADVDLSGLSLPNNFQVRFKSLMPSGSGAYVTFDNVRTVYDARPTGFRYATTEQERMLASTMGIASDGTRLYVSNYRLDTIDIFDINSSAYLGSFSGGSNYNPLGITVAPDGKIYVANSGSKITRYTFGNNTLENGTDIVTGLSDPAGLDFGGANQYLYVAQAGTGQIRASNLNSPGSPVFTLGSNYTHGPLGDSQFTFHYGETGIWASIAVDSTGILTVLDQQRVQRFYTEGASAGSLYQSWVGQYAGSPTSVYGFHTAQVDGSTHYLHYVVDTSHQAANMVYEVDPDWAGGPRAGWLGDGTWRVAERYPTVEGDGFRRRIWDAAAGIHRDFIYSNSIRQSPSDVNVIAYKIEANGSLRRAAIVGAEWAGVSRMEYAQGGQYVWTDTDADGVIDWNGIGEEGHATDEVTWFKPTGQAPDTSWAKPWVDDAGNVWMVQNQGDLIKVPLNGFDANGTPLYNWSNKVTVIPFDPNLAVKQVRVAPNGDIYTLNSVAGNFGAGPGEGAAAGIGNHVAHYDSSGNLISAAPTHNTSFMAISYLDEPDGDPDYYFASGPGSMQHLLYMYSDDGLLVCQNVMGAASAYGTGGWQDYYLGLSAAQDPATGKVYAYVQDVMIGKDERYRIDNMETIQRSSGNFNWSAPLVVTGYWTFDCTLDNAAGTNNGTFSGGTSPAYAAGKIGNAIDLDGADDSVEILDPVDPVAYTISAWVKPTDVTSVSIINRSSAAGTSHWLRINADSKFEHFVWDGNDHTVTGTTTVVADTWYHVAIVANNNGMMRLYVNGAEQGTAVSIGTLWIHGDRWRVGSHHATSYFDGLVDDVQLYGSVLSASQISSIYNSGNPSVPIVKATVRDAVATETAGNSAAFTISRNGSTTSPLTVDYVLGGSATNGVEYTTLSGSVTIASGSSSATVTVTPIDDSILDIDETVTLTLAYSSNYSTVIGTHTATIIDNDVVNFSTNPGWTGLNNTTSGNKYGYSAGRSNAGGAAGEIGGTFARNDGKSYYADTNLKRTYTLNDVIKASGKFSVFNSATADGDWFLGHMSSDPNNLGTMGIQFLESGGSSVRWYVRIGHPGAIVAGVTSDSNSLPNGDYNFEYTYDPTRGYFNRGLLTVRIYGGGYDQTVTKDMKQLISIGLFDMRLEPLTLDSFGIGIRGDSVSDNSGSTVQFFVDDVNYTGKKDP